MPFRLSAESAIQSSPFNTPVALVVVNIMLAQELAIFFCETCGCGDVPPGLRILSRRSADSG